MFNNETEKDIASVRNGLTFAGMEWFLRCTSLLKHPPSVASSPSHPHHFLLPRHPSRLPGHHFLLLYASLAQPLAAQTFHSSAPWPPKHHTGSQQSVEIKTNTVY